MFAANSVMLDSLIVPMPIGEDNDRAWEDISDRAVPFDFDGHSPEGCHGTDIFSADDPPIIMTAGYGALYISYEPTFSGDYLMVSPEVVLQHSWEKFIEGRFDRGAQTAAEVLYCALSEVQSEEESVRIRSALLMLNGAEDTMFVKNGPIKLKDVDIDVTVKDGDLSIGCPYHDRDKGEPVTELRVRIAPNGLGNDKSFSINKFGALFEQSCRYTCSTTFLDPLNEERELYLKMLNDALGQELKTDEKEMVQLVIDLLTNKRAVPEWLQTL
jgi:hypothetical protein